MSSLVLLEMSRWKPAQVVPRLLTVRQKHWAMQLWCVKCGKSKAYPPPHNFSPLQSEPLVLPPESRVALAPCERQSGTSENYPCFLMAVIFSASPGSDVADESANLPFMSPSSRSWKNTANRVPNFNSISCTSLTVTTHSERYETRVRAV